MFFGYMAVVGILAGAILVAFPSVGDSWFKPYFWVLISVALFDGVGLLRRQSQTGTVLSMEARLLGFVIGIVLMVVVPTLAGSSARFSSAWERLPVVLYVFQLRQLHPRSAAGVVSLPHPKTVVVEKFNSLTFQG